MRESYTCSVCGRAFRLIQDGTNFAARCPFCGGTDKDLVQSPVVDAIVEDLDKESGRYRPESVSTSPLFECPKCKHEFESRIINGKGVSCPVCRTMPAVPKTPGASAVVAKAVCESKKSKYAKRSWKMLTELKQTKDTFLALMKMLGVPQSRVLDFGTQLDKIVSDVEKEREIKLKKVRW